MIIPGASWFSVQDGDPRALWLARRHYSWRAYRDHRRHTRMVGPGEYLVLLTAACDALLIWRRMPRDQEREPGVCCSLFRNEGRSGLSSDLIREACDLAWQRWPGQRLYTYVDPRRVRSSHPGYCFKAAGWRRCGRTPGGLLILETQPGRQ